MSTRDHRRPHGFTLIELMVVIAIVAILMSLALPSYRSYIQRGKRTEAKTQLLQVAQYIHRFYAANDSYALTRDGKSVVESGVMPNQFRQSPPTGTALYTLDDAATNFTASSFKLRFIRASDGSMAADPCGTFVLDNTGGKDIADNDSAMTRADCWR